MAAPIRVDGFYFSTDSNRIEEELFMIHDDQPTFQKSSESAQIVMVIVVTMTMMTTMMMTRMMTMTMMIVMTTFQRRSQVVSQLSLG